MKQTWSDYQSVCSHILRGLEVPGTWIFKCFRVVKRCPAPGFSSVLELLKGARHLFSGAGHVCNSGGSLWGYSITRCVRRGGVISYDCASDASGHDVFERGFYGHGIYEHGICANDISW